MQKRCATAAVSQRFCKRKLVPFACAKVLEDSTGLHLTVRDEPSSTNFFRTDFSPSNTLQAYRAAVSAKLSPEPFELLHRYLPRATRAEDAKNIELVLDQRVGTIRRLNCIEALLLEEQIKRAPLMETKPTEFLATFLIKGERVRVYYLTNDAVGVGGMARFHEEIERDVQQGWRVEGNLHNHSFFLDDVDGDAPQGVLAPSGSDIHVLKGSVESFKLERARITNGFHTLTIYASDLAAFASTPRYQFPFAEAALLQKGNWYLQRSIRPSSSSTFFIDVGRGFSLRRSRNPKPKSSSSATMVQFC